MWSVEDKSTTTSPQSFKNGVKKGHASLSAAARGTCSPLTFIELDALQEFNVAYIFFFLLLLFACLSFYVEFCTTTTTTAKAARINKWEVLLWKVLPESWGRIWRPSPSAQCAADLSALLWRTLSCPRWKGNWNAFHLQMRAPTAERAESGGSSHEPASSSTETTKSLPVHCWNNNAHALMSLSQNENVDTSAFIAPTDSTSCWCQTVFYREFCKDLK